MRAIFEQLNLNEHQSFHYRKIVKPIFDSSYHFHPEFELTYIEKGTGLRYIGSHSERFEAGDLVFIGSDLPHCWISDDNNLINEDSSAIVIQFKQEFLGQDFFNFPEFGRIRQLMEIAKEGIILNDNFKNIIINSMRNMELEPPINRIQSLINILDLFSQATNYKIANSFLVNKKYNISGNSRFQKVFSHIIQNYTREIDLVEIAEIANLSRTSFCRYFKEVTNKTFIEVVFEFRLEKAGYLLKTTRLPVQQICFDSGFNDIPFFNKVFKKKFDLAPIKYRNMFKTIESI